MSSAEALVLFERIHRQEARDLRLDHLGLADAAERAVLWGISASLESLLVKPFAENYEELLDAARAAVRPGAE